MKTLRYSRKALGIIDSYFNNYVAAKYSTDLAQRAFRTSRIRACLTFIDAYLDNAYSIEGQNFITIDNFADVEYMETNSEILILDIHFLEP